MRFMIRPMSLSIRLFTNIMAVHTLFVLITTVYIPYTIKCISFDKPFNIYDMDMYNSHKNNGTADSNICVYTINM